jgi:hypothetical protein
LPGAPFELRSLDGRIESHGQTLTTSSLLLSLGPGGQLEIGTPEAPAVIELSSLQPPDVGTITVRLRGRDLATGAPISGLRLRDLDLQLNLDHVLEGPLRVGGDVWIEGASLVPTQLRPPGSGGALRRGTRMAKALFPDVILDVGVHSRAGALEVLVPHLPDLSVTLDCRVSGSWRRPHVTGRARGKGVYSRVAIFLYDIFTDAHVRRCGAK